MPPAVSRVAIRLVVLAVPALTFRSAKLTVTVSFGSTELFPGAQLSRAKVAELAARVARKSSFTMVHVPWLLVTVALTWPLKLTTNVSLDSLRESDRRGMLMV